MWIDPVERLLTDAITNGWLDRISTMITPQSPVVESAPWVTGLLAERDIKVVPARKQQWTPTLLDTNQRHTDRLTSARQGGAHRLSVACPHRYAELMGDRAFPLPAVMMAARLTRAAAQLASSHLGELGNSFFDGGELAEVLNTVAATSQQAVAARRLGLRHPEAGRGEMGLAAEAAPKWARRTTAAAVRSRNRLLVCAVQRHQDRDAGALVDALLQQHISAEIVALAAEAIALWSADPLPVGDIEYAARMATGRCWR